MTVENIKPIQSFKTNGTTTVFAFNFSVEGKDNINVTVDGTTVSINDYSYNADINAVVFNTAPVQNVEVVIERVTSLERSINYQTYDDSLRPETLNYDLDKLWYVAQELHLKDNKLDEKIQKFRDDVNLTALEVTLDQVKTIRDNTAEFVENIQNNVDQSQILLTQTTQQANSANTSAIDANIAKVQAQQSVVDADTINASTKQALYSFQNGAIKAYPTLADANADITNIALNTKVTVLNSSEGGDYYKATSTATSLTKSPYDPLEQAKRYSNSLEVEGIKQNFFTSPELLGEDLSRITPSASRASASKSGNSIKLTSITTGTTKTEFRWRFSAALFKSGVISASLKVLSMTASSGFITNAAQFIIWQTTSTGSSITQNAITFNNESAITDEKIVKIENIALNPTAEYVEIGVSFSGAEYRDLYLTNLFVSDTSQGDFIRPTINRRNVFPDQYLCGKRATTFPTTSIVTLAGGNAQIDLEATTSGRNALWTLPAVGMFRTGAVVRFKADVYSGAIAANSSSLLLLFYSSAGVELKRVEKLSAIANVWETISVEMAVPTDCAYIGLRINKYTATTVGKFKNLELSSNLNPTDIASEYPLTVLFVDPVNGSDLNIGTRNLPVKTYAAADRLATENTKIILATGDYTDIPQITSKIINLQIEAARNSEVNFIGGTQLTGFTKTASYTKVWQCNVTDDPLLAADRCGFWLYQHGMADTETVITRRYPQQLGRTNRIQDTCRIWKVDSIAAIESATKPSWFWQSGIMYLSCIGNDPTTQNIRMPHKTQSSFYGSNTTKDQAIKLVGINVYYCLNGFRTWDLTSVEFDHCKSIGNRTNGFETSDSNYVKLTNCEAYANWVDGCGGHIYRENIKKLSSFHDGYHNYFHDNGDDGFSYHEMWSGATVGMLCEYNGDRGIADAVGAHFQHYSPILYKNGQGQGLWSIDDGAGHACVGTAIDGGVSTDSTVFNAVSEGNLINFNTAGNALNTSNLFNCKSYNPVTSHYACDKGVMNLYDSNYSGSGTIKSATGGGVINIINSEKVT